MKQYGRLFIIGIDSAPVWIIKELSRQLKLKGFETIMQKGQIDDLESTLPPITAAAWPSIYTGLTPGEHGVMNFFSLDRNYTKKLTFYDAGKYIPFWDALSDVGIRSLIVTPAMVTEPSSRKNVDMVTGFPLKPRFSSAALEKAAGAMQFDGEPEIEQDLKDGKMSLRVATKYYIDSIRKRSEFSKKLVQKGDYGLVFVCFTETDRMQHYTLNLPDWKDYVGPLYAEISKFLEWIEGQMGADDGLMIVSDHGAQPIRKKLLLNSLLVKKGYAALTDSANIGGSIIDVTTSSRESSDSEGLRDQKYQDQLQLTSKQPVTRFICASVVENEDDFVNKRSFDMKGTKAFASLSNNPVSNIWINDSRFSKPSVDAKSRAALVKRLTEELSSFTDGGEKVFGKIHDGKEYYKGTKLFIEPDIIVEAGRGYTIDVFNHSDEIIGEPEAARRGDHTRQGVFGFYSKARKADTKGISVLDISPTVFDYYGAKVNRAGAGSSRLR